MVLQTSQRLCQSARVAIEEFAGSRWPVEQVCEGVESNIRYHPYWAGIERVQVLNVSMPYSLPDSGYEGYSVVEVRARLYRWYKDGACDDDPFWSQEKCSVLFDDNENIVTIDFALDSQHAIDREHLIGSKPRSSPES